MSGSPLKMGFLMDPIDRILPDKDTTFVFIMESQNRGHEVLYFTPPDMYAVDGSVRAVLTPAQVKRGTPHYSLGAPYEADLKSLDVVFFRTDPPFTMDYLYQSYLLDLVEAQGVFVTNRPQGVRDANEKLFAVHFADFMPPHIVTNSISRLKGFLDEAGGRMVVKPLNRAGGEGIFVVEAGDRNTNAILEEATDFGKCRIIAQKYIPEVREGDKRILLLDGELLGATSRIPADDEHRANIHVGGDCVKYVPNDRDMEIIKRVGPELRKRGLHFVGLDVLGDYITEINVTSPTGIQEINWLENVNLESKVIDFVEREVAGKSR